MDEVTRMRQFMDPIRRLWEQDDSATHHRQPLSLYHRHNRLHLFRQQQQQNQRSCFSDSNDDDKPTSCHPKPTTFTTPEPYRPPPAKRARCNRKSLPVPPLATAAMDPQIWTHLPEDLLEAILARLPVTSFLRFRTVSKNWNSLLTSSTFSRHCARIPKPRPWFFTTAHEKPNSGAMYDPASNKWRYPVIPSKTVLMPVASSGGLVCFMDIGHCHIFIANPLTGVFKALPPRPVKVWSRMVVGMTSKKDGSYKVVWVGYDGKYGVYDSVVGRWSQPRRAVGTAAEIGLLNFQSPCVCLGSTLYFFHANGMLAYDTEVETDSDGNRGVGWKEMVIPMPSNVVDYVGVEGGRGGVGVMMVGMVRRNEATCVCVWELQRMTLLWKEVDRMPNVWCLEFYGKPRIKMSCLGTKAGLLMLSLRYKQMNRFLTYDTVTKEWRKIPSRGGCSGRGRRHGIVVGTAFHPSLTAQP